MRSFHSTLTYLFLCLTLCLCGSVDLFCQTQTGRFDRSPLRDALNFAEQRYDVRFSYSDRLVDSATVNFDFENKVLDEAVKELMEQCRLTYRYIDRKRIAILPDPDQIDRSFELCGRIVDALSSESLPLANVWLLGGDAGTSTDEIGRFAMSLPLRQRDSLVITYIGYRTQLVPAFLFIKNPCLEVRMVLDQQLIESITVTEYLGVGIDQTEGGNAVNIQPERLNVLPGMAEPDLFGAIQILPGVTSTDETASGLYIRGGTPDQNLVLWDGIPVYSSGHLFGMISAFNPFFVESVNVYRSSIRPEYGGRASSVIDIRSDDEIPQATEADIGLNMIHATGNVRFPLWKNSGMGLSLRRSITDFAPTFTFRKYAEKVFQGTKIDFDQPIPGLSEADAKDKYFFSDVNFKWQWNPGKNRFSLHAFSGNNSLDYNSTYNQFLFSEDILNLETGGFNMAWDRTWSDKLSTSMKIYNADYLSEYTLNLSLLNDISNVLFRARQNNRVMDSGGELSALWKPLKDHEVKVGYQFSDHDIRLDIRNEGENESAVNEQFFRSNLHSLFAEHSLQAGELINITTGLRYQYQESLRSNHFEPRIAVHTRISDRLRLKISSSKQFQFVSQLILLDLNDTGLNNAIWIASDEMGIPVIESNQWTGGILYSNNGWTLDAEGYVKEISGITTLSSGFGNLPEQPFSFGNSRIRGIDVLAKKRMKNWQTWVSYTFSEAEYEFKEIKQSSFPASHDMPHNLQWIAMYNKRPWEFSVGWQLRSGLPWTAPESIATQTDANGNTEEYISYGVQNGQRLGAYHRMDASAVYHLPPFRDSKARAVVGLSVINLYDRRNILGKDFLIDEGDPGDPADSEIIEIDKTGLRFLPNVVFRISW